MGTQLAFCSGPRTLCCIVTTRASWIEKRIITASTRLGAMIPNPKCLASEPIDAGNNDCLADRCWQSQDRSASPGPRRCGAAGSRFHLLSSGLPLDRCRRNAVSLGVAWPARTRAIPLKRVMPICSSPVPSSFRRHSAASGTSRCEHKDRVSYRHRHPRPCCAHALAR